MSALGKFSCDACSKSYSWKPELAGRRVKCKCGHVLSVPKDDPAAPPPPPLSDDFPPDFDSLYALADGNPVEEPVTPPPVRGTGGACPSCHSPVDAGAVLCVNCGTNLKTGKKLKTTRAGGGGGTPVLAGVGVGAGGGAGILGYVGSKRGVSADGTPRDRGNVFFHPVKDLYIPAALVLIGTVLTYLGMVYNRGVTSPGYAMFAVGLVCFINVVLTIPAILMTIKMFDLGLGPIGPGTLKLAACAILPGGISELLRMFLSGWVGGYIGWFLSFAATVIIFMKLLEMDYFETIVCSTVIWLIETWAGYAILIAIFSNAGAGSPLASLAAGGPLGGLGGGGGSGQYTLAGDEYDADHDAPELDKVRANEANADINYMLEGKGYDGKTWITEKEDRILTGMTRARSVELINSFYDAGCTEVRVYPTKRNGVEQVTEMIVLAPGGDTPELAARRARVFALLPPLANQLGRVKPRDRGEKGWQVQMLTNKERKKIEAEPDAAAEAAEAARPKKPGAKDEDDEDDK
jgi:hypothetical protein